MEKVRVILVGVKTIARKRTLPNFGVGYDVMVALFNKEAAQNKPWSVWTGPFRWYPRGGGRHKYWEDDIVTGECKKVHVAPVFSYTDGSRLVTAQLVGVVTTPKTPGGSKRGLFGPWPSVPTKTPNGGGGGYKEKEQLLMSRR